MAIVRNDRDILLQAAAIRLVPLPIDDTVGEIIDAIKGVELGATSLQFKVPVSGATTPASITLTAKRTLLDGAVTWSVVAGTATLTGTGATTRTLTPTNMSSQSATVRATVVDGAVTYYDDITIVKVLDGAAGDDGVRGTVMLSTTITGTAWNDTVANNLITSATGSSVRVVGDLVSQINPNAAYGQMRRWSGTAWVIQQHMFSGDVIVEKTLSANRVKGGSFVGEVFTGGRFSGAVIEGSSEISVTTNGNFTLQGIGVGGVRLYKLIYYGNAGVMDMDLTLNQYGPTYMADLSTPYMTAGRIILNGPLEGSVGNDVLMNGRKFWVDLGSGPVEMEIGVRIS